MCFVKPPSNTQEFPTGESSSFPAFLLGSALTAVLALSLIGFGLRRTNVLETSLVFVYVVVSFVPCYPLLLVDIQPPQY